MRPDTDKSNIVLAGAWNNAILNPNWLAREILGAERIQMELQLTVGAADARVVTFPEHGLKVVQRPDKLVLAPLSFTVAGLTRVSDFATKLLRKLPYTPMRAVGVNVGFVSPEPIAQVTDIFRLNDPVNWPDHGLEMQGIKITRSIGGIRDMPGNPLLLTTLESQLNTGAMTIGMNYHFQIGDAAACATALDGAFVRCARHVRQVMDWYGVDIEYEGEDWNAG
jgi:hypothetical protein